MFPKIAITAKTEELRSRSQATIPVAYAKAIEEAGGLPFIVPVIHSRENVAAVAQWADGFIFSGGDDIRPGYYGEEILLPLELSPDERTDFELALFNEALRLRKPILGICLGAQLINVALGGTLYQDIPTQIPNSLNHRDRHIVSIKAGTLLHRILGDDNEKPPPLNPLPRGEGKQIPPPHYFKSTGGVKGEGDRGLSNEIHVTSAHHQAVKSPGKGLIVSAASGDGVVEAIEMIDHPFCLGVQWHPERELNDEYTKRLFSVFIKMAEECSAHWHSPDNRNSY